MQGFMKVMAGSLVFAATLAACQGGENTDQASMSDTTSAATAYTPAASASATISDASGNELGTLTLTDTDGGIHLQGTLRGLPPGPRAFHLHSVGQCEAPFTSAGPHWNPTNAEHGRDNPAGQHFGDMSNITVASDSSVTIDATTPGGTLAGDLGLLDADGASVVIHATVDDYKSDPSGNAGDRIACGPVTAN